MRQQGQVPGTGGISVEGKSWRQTLLWHCFSHEEDYVAPVTVMQKIDNNHRGLKKGDKRICCPSIPHRMKRSTDPEGYRKAGGGIWKLTVEEQEKVIHELKNYSRNCMDLYAENFRREDKIRKGSCLFWEVETERHYRNSDEDVKEGQAKSGDRKPGLQLHVHIIVSRNDADTNGIIVTISKKQRIHSMNWMVKVMVGFEHMGGNPGVRTGSSACMMVTRPHTGITRDGREHTYHYVPGKNEAMSMAKSAILQKKFRKTEEDAGCVLPDVPFHGESKQALMAEAKDW